MSEERRNDPIYADLISEFRSIKNFEDVPRPQRDGIWADSQVLHYSGYVFIIEAFLLMREMPERYYLEQYDRWTRGLWRPDLYVPIVHQDLVAMHQKFLPQTVFEMFEGLNRQRNLHAHSGIGTASTADLCTFLTGCMAAFGWFFSEYMNDPATSAEIRQAMQARIASLGPLEDISTPQDDSLDSALSFDAAIESVYVRAFCPKQPFIDVVVFEIKGCCQMILADILRKEGVGIDENRGFVIERKRYLSLLDYVIHEEPPYISRGCLQFLRAILDARNQAAHLRIVEPEAYDTCLKAFDSFLLWYYRFYRGEGSLYDGLVQRTKKDGGANLASEALVTGQEWMPAVEADYNLSRFASEMRERLERISERVESVSGGVSESNRKLDTIQQTLAGITNCISDYQELVDSHLKNISDLESREMLMETFTDQCVKKIRDDYSSVRSETDYVHHKELLALVLGNAWNKLSEPARACLVSAKMMFGALANLKNAVDYSGVCILVTKAVEYELFVRFFSDYVVHVTSRHPIEVEGAKWPPAIVDAVKRHGVRTYSVKQDLKITLGSYPFILGAFPTKTDKPSAVADREKNWAAFLEYAKEWLFDAKYDDEDIQLMMLDYADSIDRIVHKYRNPSAHRNAITMQSASDCFAYVVEVQQVLRKMLDSFRY